MLFQTTSSFLRIAAVTVSLVSGAAAQQDSVVARVNGSDITISEVEVAAEIYGDQLGNMPEDARLSILVDALIEAQLLSDAARARSLDQGEAFKRRMAFLERQALRTILLNTSIAEKVTDAAVRQAYDAEVAAAAPTTEVRISHILVASEVDARAIIAEIAAGADFAALARAKSQDQASGANGGDLGFAVAGTLMAEIEAAASTLQPGEVAEEPVTSPFGFHVVRLEEKRDRPAPALEERVPELRAILEARAAQELIAGLRAAATIEKLVPDVRPPAGGDGHQH